MRSNQTLLPLIFLLALGTGCSRDGPPPAESTASVGPPAGASADGSRAPPSAPPAAAEVLPTGGPPPVEDLVRADDSLASLQTRLGAANVVPETLPGAEGETISGWILYPDDPARRLSVYLDDTGEQPLMLLAGKDATAWKRADGVRVGLSSQELANLNGGPFGFMGFDWDYGGVVTDWRGGRLAPEGASAGPVTLCRPDLGDGVALEDYPTGDSEFRSDDPRLLVNPARVCAFGVNIDPPPAKPEAG